MPKKPIIIISVLCVISLALGYLSGLKDGESPFNSSGETNAGTQTLPPHPNAVEWNGHWYLLVENTSSWENAKSECEKLGGYLTIIDNESENEFLRNMVLEHKAVSDAVTKYKSHVFLHIGCLRSSEKNGWEWINGKSVDYSNWSPETIVNRNTYGGMALSSVNGYPSVKPGDWVNDHGMGFYVCEWDSTPLTPSGFTDKAPDFLKEGLVAYYPFNGNAKDESGNGHDGEVNGAKLVNDRNDISGHAYSFDGEKDYIRIPNASDFHATSLTISAWYKASSFYGHGHNPIIQKPAPNHNYPLYQWSLYLKGDQYPSQSGSGFFGLGVSQKGDTYAYSDLLAERFNGVWHQIVGCINATDKHINLFLNGEKLMQTAIPDSTAHEYSTDIYIARHGNIIGKLSRNFTKGVIDDIRIYNRALSGEEVKALYEFEKAE